MVARSAKSRRAKACGLAVVRGFVSVPVEEISKSSTRRPRGGRTEYLETELNHISQNKIISRQSLLLFRSTLKLYVVFLSYEYCNIVDTTKVAVSTGGVSS